MRRPGRRVIGAVTLVTALVLALGAAGLQRPTTALAAPSGPSWDDVQEAKGDVEATEIAIARILDTVAEVNAEFEQLRTAALMAGEEHQQATIALDEAETTMQSADRRRDAALERASASGQQAAQLAALLARAGSGDITMALIVSGDDADDLLYRLGTMSALSARTDAVLARALRDRNVADSLSDQAAVARDAHADAVAEAEAVYAAAADAAQQAEAQAAQQRALLDELSVKLATLTGRSAALERAYLDSLEHAEPPSNPGPGQPSQPSPSPSAPAPGPSPSTPAPTPSQPTPRPSTPAPAPSPSSPAPTPAPSPPAPTPSPPPAASGPTPKPAIVTAAIAFARAQLGEPYQYGASGPNSWDCSGLTMMAYSAGGLAIGGHSVSAQYNRAASRGLLVSYSQALPGDLIFYSYGGSASGSKYHVTIYLGNGQMIEAPSPGKPVRIVPVRTYDRIPVVARPSG
ncbi:C40 family peptidase [Microcella humidisoli]|uniref:C40 family peptidase n=1 Tax=Microcella humidisoli TaxID=2963406 RepID=A0ABY5FYV1_9MICO|nr:C40 family peptidase [Microcella humidisoli]UTT63311.1 C40 family peptidase [Microcella humidisoli]